MINVGIAGAAGYSGLELIKILVNHPEVNISKLFGHSSVGSGIEEIHHALKKVFEAKIESFSPEKLDGLDLLFAALPSGQSMGIIADAIAAGKKVIDLGGDFRIKDVKVYEQYYNHKHTAEILLQKSVYGLSEWNEKEIRNAQLIANPGCYPTSILPALLPLLENGLIDENNISITSYSGTSGAGKSVTSGLMFSEVNESVKAYKVGNHQHIPEIDLYLEKFSGKKSSFTFVPHLLPVTRGIYTTIHSKLSTEISSNKINDAYMNKYSSTSFIRFYGNNIPEMKNVTNTNFCDIGFKLVDDKIIILSTIDNLIKGAAGQAIQNMNIMFGFNQETGLSACKKNNLSISI